MTDFKKISECVINGKADEVKELVQKAIDEGEDVEKILNEALIAGMDIVGRRCGEDFKRSSYCRNGYSRRKI